MALNIKSKELPFDLVGDQVRYPNGQLEPVNGTHLALVQIFLLKEILAEQKKSNETPEPPQPVAKTK